MTLLSSSFYGEDAMESVYRCSVSDVMTQLHFGDFMSRKTMTGSMVILEMKELTFSFIL